MVARRFVGSFLLVAAVLGAGGGLAAWKLDALDQAGRLAAEQPEPMEVVEVAIAREARHQRTVTAIGTVLALQSVTLRNELPGTVEQVSLTPGRIVEPGTVLVRLDVSVEQAELAAHEARAALAEAVLQRHQRANANRAVSDVEVERARAERDVALADVARIRAVIERKTIRAPFRARVGLADVHRGQYLEAGTLLTTLQGVDRAAHVDFQVAQQVAAGLRQGDRVGLASGGASRTATVVAIDARVDATTRTAQVRARLADATEALAPGASVRVSIPVGAPEAAVVVPLNALRRGPGGDHVFVVELDEQGVTRARQREVASGSLTGDGILLHAGVTSGERVATSGSFKLFESMRVAVAGGAVEASGAAAASK